MLLKTKIQTEITRMYTILKVGEGFTFIEFYWLLGVLNPNNQNSV